MAEDIVKGLFGLSPYEIQQQRIADTNTQAHNYATLDPFQKASQSMFQAGAGLGGVGAQMAGYVNPAEEKAQQKQAILSRYDISTQEGQAQAMQAAKAMGRMDIVLELQQYDNSMQKEYYARKLTQSQIEQNTANAEKRRRIGEARTHSGYDTWKKLAEAKYPDDPAAQDNFIEALYNKATKAQNIETTYKFKGGRRIKIMLNKDTGEVTEIGDEEGDKHPPFDQGVPGSNPPLVQHMVWNSVAGIYEAVGEPKPAHSGVTVNLPPQEKAFEGQLGKGQAEELIKGRASADDAVQIIKTAQTGRAILDKGMVTGFGANFIVSAGQALKQAGIDFGGDATSNSQAYAANMAQNVGKIIKQFGSGTGLSDADREYATKMAAGLITLDEKSLRKILDINETQARWIINQHNSRAQGIKSNIPLTVDMPASSAKTVIREVKLKDGRIGVEYSDGTKGYK